MTYDSFTYFLTAVLIVLIIVKTFLFFTSTNNRRLENWFFFSNYAVYNSRSDRSRKLKILQNRLSVTILCLGIIDLIIVLLFHSGLIK